MADESKEELENKKQQAQVEKDINSTYSARQQAYKDSVKYSGEALDISRQITEDVKDQLGMANAKSEADRGALSLARQLQKSAALVTTELGNQGMISKQLQSDQNLQSAILTEISALTKDLSIEEQDRAKYITELLSSQEDNYNKIKKLEEEMLLLTDEQKVAHQDKIKRLQDQNAISEESIKNATVEGSIVNESNVRRLVQLKQQNELTAELIRQRKEELRVQREIEDTMGVTGALIEGVGGIMQRLGMRSGIFASAMEDAKNAMHEVAEEAVRSNKEYNETAVKLKAMAAGAKKLGAGFAKALFDPLSIILKIADAFFKVDRAATDLQRLTGQNSTALGGMNMRLATTVDFLEVATELTKQTGMNAQNIFSRDVIAGAAELKNTMGLAANEAGGLATIAQTTSGNIDDVTASIVDTTSAFNKSNRSAVSQGQILRDVATAADGIKASFAGNPEALAKAAAAARRLGMEIGQVDRIASSLMDFESSIEAELEAQLLTGKNINMAKARELALNNDLAGLGKELFKNSSDIAEFGKMNRIQQEAQAKALGMSRDELGKIAYQRALEKGMTEDQAAAAANVNAEDMKRLAVQDKIQMSLDKLAQAFAPMLDIAAELVDIISLILRPITFVVGGVMRLASAFSDYLTPNIESTDDKITVFFKKIGSALASIPKLIAGIGILALGNSIKNLVSGKGLKFDLFDKIKGKITGVADTAKEKGKEMAESLAEKGKDKVKDVAAKGKDKVEDLASKAGDKTSKVAQAEPKSTGKNIKEFLQNLGRGIKSFGKSVTFKDIAKIAAAGAGFLVFTLAAPGLAVVALLGTPAGIGLTALGKGIQAFGNSMQALGPMGLAYAAGGMVILAGGLIAAGYALNLAAPAFEAIGTAIKSAFEGIGTIVVSVGTAIASILKEITLEKAAALIAVGGGFAALGLGLASLGASLIFGMAGIGVLAGIAAMADPLSTVGTSLTAIAAGIAAISAALSTLETEKLDEIKDLVITTAFAAPMVAATGAITSMIQGISGGGEQSKSDPAMIEKLDAILAAIKEGGDVYIDGNKAGESLMLAAVKSS